MGHGFDDSLRDALQDRATRDTTQRVHFKNSNAKLLNPVLSSIVAGGRNIISRR